MHSWSSIKYQFNSLSFDPNDLQATICHKRGEHVIHYTIDVVL